MEKLKIELIKGKFINYSKVSVNEGYSFYNKDNVDEMYYMKEIMTPLLDAEKINEQYIVVVGDAEALNLIEDQKRQEALDKELANVEN